MNAEREIQYTVVFFSAAAAIGELAFVAKVADPQVGFPLPTVLLYVGFFWLLWLYARIRGPIKALLILPNWGVWLLLAAIAGAIALTYNGRSMALGGALWVGRFLSLHAMLAVAYSFICVAVIFGDSFVWPIAKHLKVGRNSSR